MIGRKKKNEKLNGQNEKMKKSERNKELAVITYIFLGIFMLLMGYFVYFNVFVSEEVINSPYNARQDVFEDRIVRGDILTNDGTVVAKTEVSSDGNQTRVYPYGNVFAHVIGYASKGKSGIESLGNFSLLRSHAFFLEKMYNEFKKEKNKGDSVVSTLLLDVQQTAYDALGDLNGAVIAIEPSTGKILAMVSKPDFNPNEIDNIWDSLVSSEDSTSTVLLNRATQGLYPPGSTFKILTTLEFLRENKNASDYTFDCQGSLTKDGVTINCYKGSVHGSVDLITSFAKSCNTSYANIGLTLNNTKFKGLCESLLFNQKLPFELPYKKSSFVLSKKSDTSEIMQTAIGQGKTQVTPLHMAMITSAIANDGELMVPYLIDSTQNYSGVSVKKNKPVSYGKLLTEKEAGIIQEYMENVVTNGTAKTLAGQSYQAAGKTGSAEFSNVKGESHSWFVGYANKGEKEIALAVIAEGAGAGSEYAVPIAKKIFDSYFN
ncbi:peptidoglycan D,D-transpeptidase FtsI family protein [Anaerosacchariphilus polymeriproducens]|nr:penicillin-binding transpeptidase domain-containing protein [Anaerosacchariphilus polymeriproducens]